MPADRKGRKAFEILARENARMLTTYLRGLVRDESVVDDLFQDTLVIAWRRLDECDLSKPFGPWLRGIASRLAMAHHRKSGRSPIALNEKTLALVDRQFEAIGARAGDTWDEKIAALRDCLAALPQTHRTAVRSRYLEGLSTRNVAARLEVSVEACKKRLQRARASLAECLRGKGVMAKWEAPS